MPIESSPKLDDFQEGMPEQLPPGHRGARPLRIAIAVLAVVVLAMGYSRLVQEGRLATLGGTGALAGQVVLEDGRPLQATVIVVKAGVSEVTDAEGRFQLERLPAGEHDLVVGYRGAGREYPVTVLSGQIVDLGQIRFISTLEPLP